MIPPPPRDQLALMRVVFTHAQIAQQFGVGVGTVQRWIADAELGPAPPVPQVPRGQKATWGDRIRALHEGCLAVIEHTISREDLHDPKLELSRARFALELWPALASMATGAPDAGATREQDEDLLERVRKVSAPAELEGERRGLRVVSA